MSLTQFAAKTSLNSFKALKNTSFPPLANQSHPQKFGQFPACFSPGAETVKIRLPEDKTFLTLKRDSPTRLEREEKKIGGSLNNLNQAYNQLNKTHYKEVANISVQQKEGRFHGKYLHIYDHLNNIKNVYNDPFSQLLRSTLIADLKRSVNWRHQKPQKVTTLPVLQALLNACQGNLATVEHGLDDAFQILNKSIPANPFTQSIAALKTDVHQELETLKSMVVSPKIPFKA